MGDDRRPSFAPSRKEATLLYLFATCVADDAEPELGPGDANRTTSPLTSESAGLRITLSDGLTPLMIWMIVPKSRPTLMSRSSTLPFGFTTPTCNPCARNNRALFGKVTTCPNEAEVRRTCA